MGDGVLLCDDDGDGISEKVIRRKYGAFCTECLLYHRKPTEFPMIHKRAAKAAL